MTYPPIVNCTLCGKPGESNKLYGVQEVSNKKLKPEMKFAHKTCLEKCEYIGNIFDKNKPND